MIVRSMINKNIPNYIDIVCCTLLAAGVANFNPLRLANFSIKYNK